MILHKFKSKACKYPLDKIGKTSIHEACRKGNIGVAADLIDFGGIRTLFIRDRDDKLPFHYLNAAKRSEMFSNSVFGKGSKFEFVDRDIVRKARRTRRKTSFNITGDYCKLAITVI